MLAAILLTNSVTRRELCLQEFLTCDECNFPPSKYHVGRTADKGVHNSVEDVLKYSKS